MTKTILLVTLALFLGGSVLQAQDNANLEKTMIGKMVNSVKLQRTGATGFTDAHLTKTPEYYILFYAASWSDQALKFTPELIEKYKTLIANNPKIEMIQVSLDRDRPAAEKWAAKDQLPWFTVLPDEIQSGGFTRFKSTRFIPEYALLSADGKRLGSGPEVFDEVKKLTR